MLLLSVAIGVASVVVLTRSARARAATCSASSRSLGKDTVVMFPGRKTPPAACRR